MFRYCFRVLKIKYFHWNRAHLLYTSIIWSFMANTGRIASTVVHKEAVTVWLKCLTNYCKIFCFGTFTIDAAILLLGKTLLKSCVRWSAVAMGKLCWTIKFVAITSAFKTLFRKTSSISSLYKEGKRVCFLQEASASREKGYCNAHLPISNPGGGKLSFSHMGGNETCNYLVSLLLSGMMLSIRFKWNLAYFWTIKHFFRNSCCCSCAFVSIYWFALFWAIVVPLLWHHFEQ